jgi:hypothetical protein
MKAEDCLKCPQIIESTLLKIDVGDCLSILVRLVKCEGMYALLPLKGEAAALLKRIEARAPKSASGKEKVK